MSCTNNSSEITQTFIIDALVSGCSSGLYANTYYSCSGNTSILLGTDSIIFNGSVYGTNFYVNLLSGSTYYGDNYYGNIFSGSTFSGDTYVGNTFSGGTYYGDGSNLTGIGDTSYLVPSVGPFSLVSLQDTVNYPNTANGNFGFAIGQLTQANGFASYSQGAFTIANGDASHAGGYLTQANGLYSFVHGSNSIASGINTIVLGGNLSGTNDNTTYVDNLNINSLGSGLVISNIGIDENGNVVRGMEVITAVTLTGNSIIFVNSTGGTTNVDGVVNTATTLNINGNEFDLNANREWVVSQASTGVLTYEGATPNSLTTINIGAVQGYIVDNETNPLEPSYIYMDYTGQTGVTVTTLGSGLGSYVMLQPNNTILFLSTYPTSKQRRDNILLSKVAHPTGFVTFVINETDYILSPISQMRDLFKPIKYINDGVYPFPNGSNLMMNITGGYIFGNGINFVIDNENPNQVAIGPISTGTTFIYRTQSGGTTGFISNISPSFYDVGGAITPAPASASTVQWIFSVPTVGFVVQYGQTIYPTLTDAISNIGKENFTVFSNLVENALLVGVVALTTTATTLNDMTQAQFFRADKFGQIAGSQAGTSTSTLQSAYDNSLQPQIVLSNLGALQIKSLTPNTNILEGANTGGTVTFNLTESGDITANTIVSNVVSATTYLGLPLDVYVTGGTLIGNSVEFTNNTGGTFSVNGFATGDTYWTSGSSGSFSIKVINDSSTDATGIYAVSEGLNTLASGIASHAEGSGTISSDMGSHAEGVFTVASGDSAHAEGNSTIAGGDYSHASGVLTRAFGASSTAIGQGSQAIGDRSFAGGINSIASGLTSFVFGSQSQARGAGSIVLGTSITGTASNTTYVNSFNIGTVTASTTGSTVLIRNADGSIAGRALSTFPDVFVTGATTNNTTRLYTFRNNTGGTFNVTGMTEVVVTGGTMSGNTAIFRNNTGGTFNVNGIVNTATTINVNGVVQNLNENREWLVSQASTGVLTYGGASANTTTTINVGPIKGYIVDNETNPLIPTYTYINHTGQTGVTVTTVSGGTGSYMLLKPDNTFLFSNTYPTSKQRRENILLSKIAHPTGVITFVLNETDYILSPISQMRDLFKPIKYINDGVYAYANGANMFVNITNGEIFGSGINFVADNENPNQVSVGPLTPTTFLYRTQTGGTTTFVSGITGGFYDVGGAITSVPVSSSTIQWIFSVPSVGFVVQYGQTLYPTLTDAISNVGKESFVVFPNLVENAILVSVLAVTSTATALTSTNQAIFFRADKFGQIVGSQAGTSTATLQSAYANSMQPQITTTSIGGALQVKAWNSPNTSILQGLDSGSTVTFNLNGGGSLTANTVFATTYLNLPSGNFTGGTVNGPTIFTNGLSANTFSATTYLNLPQSSGAFTGGTVTGATNFTNGLTASTISATTYLNTPYWISGSSGSFSIKAKNGTTDATGDYSLAEGLGSIASGEASHAEGWLSQAIGRASHTEGEQTIAIGQWSHAEGNDTLASGDYSHAEGNDTEASNEASHAEGNTTTASGFYSHAEGFGTSAEADACHAEGQSTIASGNYSHAEGSFSVAGGEVSHAEGQGTQANGQASHSEGGETIANGYGAHAEGYQTTTNADFTHAEGLQTLAEGYASHAQGWGTQAIGSQSHAGGRDSYANGEYSFVHGLNSSADGPFSVVLGANLVGSGTNTTYVASLNINNVQTGTSVSNLGVDATGNVVQTTGGGDSDATDYMYMVSFRGLYNY